MKKRVYSWMKVFKQDSYVKEVECYRSLHKYIKKGYFPSGSLHSYNRQALHPKMLKLGGRFKQLKYNELCKTIQVGAGVTIKEVMVELLKYNRKLKNSGNYFRQTFVGASVGGTHGYGHNSALADSILQFEGVFQEGNELHTMIVNDISYLRAPSLKAVTWVIVDTEPTKSYKVTNCVCNLSDIEPNDPKISRAYAVLPYSDPQDPVCMVALYEPNTTVKYPDQGSQRRVRPWHWWRVKLWWKVDQFFPPLRKWIQRGLNFIKLKPFVIYTNPNDYDSLYDPDVGLVGTTYVEGKSPISFSRLSYRPTYTSYNISLFCQPTDTKELLRFIIKESEELKSTLLRCFIGVRCLQGKSSVCFVGNADGDRDAIDMYCSPKHADYLIRLQEKIQLQFDVRPHYGKTVFR